MAYERKCRFCHNRTVPATPGQPSDGYESCTQCGGDGEVPGDKYIRIHVWNRKDSKQWLSAFTYEHDMGVDWFWTLLTIMCDDVIRDTHEERGWEVQDMMWRFDCHYVAEFIDPII